MKQFTKRWFMLLSCLAVLALSAYWLLTKAHDPKVQTVPAAQCDYGYQSAVRQNLLQGVAASFDGLNATVDAVYFDGNRLYAVVKAAQDVDMQGAELTLVHAAGEKKQDQMERIDDERLVVIWNACEPAQSGNKILCRCADGQVYASPEIEIPAAKMEHLEIEKQFEELYIRSICEADTSTLIDLDVYALLELHGFQIETSEGFFSDVMMEHNDKNYKLLFPAHTELSDEFTIYGKDREGFVMMTIPVKLYD